MDKLVIQGRRPLHGEVVISGAKNSALPLLAATLLAPGRHQLENVPHLRDIETFKRLLSNLGARPEPGIPLSVDSTEITSVEAPYELVKTMRASVLVLGPLLARTGRARVSLPGGCAIGARPIDLHLRALETLGARIELSHGYVEATARRLKGGPVALDFPTVTGTENVMMAAALADGTTTIQNAAREPEIADLAAALTGMGAKVTGAGTGTVLIEGARELKPMRHRVMPDRIETGTFLCAVAMTGGEVTIKGAEPAHLEAITVKLRAAGAELESRPGVFTVRAEPGGLKGVDVKTLPYPGFATDMQAQFMATMSTAAGDSVISETVFENRFKHVPELIRMGAEIRVEGSSALVKGLAGRPLSGAHVMATDLRASASLVLAGLAAEGETHVHRVYHLDRGYERIEEKLALLGAVVRRVRDEIL